MIKTDFLIYEKKIGNLPCTISITIERTGRLDYLQIFGRDNG